MRLQCGILGAVVWQLKREKVVISRTSRQTNVARLSASRTSRSIAMAAQLETATRSPKYPMKIIEGDVCACPSQLY